MTKLTIIVSAAALAVSSALGQSVQSNNTGPATTAEPAATTVNSQGQVTGAALIPASPGAARTPDPGTHLGAGNTAPGLYSNQLTRLGDMKSSATVANPHGEAIIQNPGVRSGTQPVVKPGNTVSQTNLGANNTATLNSNSKPDGQTNRPATSKPGNASGLSAGAAAGGSGSGTGF